jgi:putative ABC transport system substrate-binding protein
LRALLLCIPALLLALPTFAADLLILQSQRRPVYDQAAKLIRSDCGAGSETLVLSDYAEIDLARIVREEQPRLVVAIGEQAFKEARKLRRTPVVYAMTLNIDENALANNINGVSMYVSPENYMKLFAKLQLRQIGVLYDPRHSGAYLERARKAAAAAGVELTAIKVRSPREVPDALNRLTNLQVDALWMIPDSSAVSAESIDAYFLTAQKLNLPVFSFAKGYLAKGAVAVLEGANRSITSQSCSLVRNLLAGVPPADLSSVDIRDAVLFVNENVANKLQLKLSGTERLFSPKTD